MSGRPATLATDRARFAARIGVPPDPDACWTWRGGMRYGYGSFNLRGRTMFASRACYPLFRGDDPNELAVIPDGYDVCHSCDNRPCTNPAHLWLGTRLENVRDCVAKGRARGGRERVSVCRQGHPRNFDKWGNCRDCARDFDARRASGWERQREAVRRLSAFLPQSPQFATALAYDEATAPQIVNHDIAGLAESAAGMPETDGAT